LEVGTGFHPELTGRENIYLNGAILGMTKKEITAKFDEIVDFSGVEKYIDTPVKRYSSGMYVRLAFAVAAHLEPEILIVDEVLAVGDAEFQKKCLGKMKDVSTHGRTILFVSHNMTAIQSLCKKAVFLKNGTLHSSGECGAVVSQYLSVFADVNVKQVWDINMAPGNNEVKLLKAMVAMPEGKEFFSAGDPVEIEFEYLNLGTGKEEQYGITIHLFDELNNLVFVSGSAAEVTTRQLNGRFYGRARIPENLLHEGTYTIGRLLFVRNRGQVVYEHLDVLTFEVINKNSQLGWMGKKEGVVKPKINWEIQLTND
jgi:lipopolysaccharide transport system ATP-binding protein